MESLNDEEKQRDDYLFNSFIEEFEKIKYHIPLTKIKYETDLMMFIAMGTEI